MTRPVAACLLAAAILAAGASPSVATAADQAGVQPQATPPRDARVPGPTGSVRVHGRVVTSNSDITVPVSDATVVLYATLPDRTERALPVSTTATGRAWVATTDRQGAFDFRDLPASSFTLRITKTGFAAGSTAVTADMLKDGQAIDLGALLLTRSAAIAGRVVDGYGDPVADVMVQALRVSYSAAGDRRLVSARQASTNDLGEYRLHSLPPGTYFVSAGLGPGSPPSYRGGTSVAAEAQPTIVHAGDQAFGIDISLNAGALGQLSGRVIDSLGQAGPDFVVVLTSARRLGASTATTVRTETDQEGRFSFANLALGDYQVDVLAFASAGAIATAGTASPVPGRLTPEVASVPVTVGVYADDVLIRTSRGFDLRGRVLIDGQRPPPAALEGLKVSSVPVLLAGSTGASYFSNVVDVAADGTFVIAGLAGAQQIGTMGGRGASLQRVVVGGVDVTDDGVVVDRGNIDGAEIALTSVPTIIKGHVVDAEGNRTIGVVVIFAEDQNLLTKFRSRYIASARADAASGFSIAGLPAGRYLAVAVEFLEADQRANPDALDLLRSKAAAITVGDGGTQTLVIRRR